MGLASGPPPPPSPPIAAASGPADLALIWIWKFRGPLQDLQMDGNGVILGRWRCPWDSLGCMFFAFPLPITPITCRGFIRYQQPAVLLFQEGEKGGLVGESQAPGPERLPRHP